MSEDRIEYEPEPSSKEAVAQSAMLELLLGTLKFIENESRLDSGRSRTNSGGGPEVQAALGRVGPLFQAYSTSRLVETLAGTNEILERVIAQLEAIEGELMKLPPRLGKIEDELRRRPSGQV